MKRTLILGLTVLLVLGATQLAMAANWTLSTGVELQSGNYDLTGTWDYAYEPDYVSAMLVSGGKDTYSAAIPLVRLSAEAVSDQNWVLSGFVALPYESDKATLGGDDPIYDPDGDEKPYAFSRAYGADLGYRFETGDWAVTPKLGYRNTVFMTGLQWSDDDGCFYKGAGGLEISGARLGVEAKRQVADRLMLKAEAGVLLGAKAFELEYDAYDAGYESKKQDLYRWEPGNSATTAYDAALTAEYQANDLWSVTGGYRYEAGSLTIDNPGDSYWYNRSESWGYKKYEWTSGQLFLGAKLTF